MKPIKSIATLFFLCIALSLSAQRVHYKDNYYTLVNSKIFHLGHNIYGKLTQGERDTLYMIARELYNDKGKMKPHYKARRKRDRYKLPEGYWEQKKAEAEQVNKAAPVVAVAKVVTDKDENDKAFAETETEAEKTAQVKEASDKVVSSEQQKIANQEESNQAQERKPNEDKVKAEKKSDKEDALAREKAQKPEEEQEKKVAEKQASKEDTLKREKSTDKKQKSKKKDKAEKQAKEAKAKKNKEEKFAKAEKKQERKVEKTESKLDKKERSLEKKAKKQAKQQKSLNAAQQAITAATVVTATQSNNSNDFGTIYLKINKEKTFTDSLGNILLFFDVINNSNNDLVILKPNNSFDDRLDFFTNTLECDDIPVSSTDYLPKFLKIKEDDYLTIPANAKVELLINGKYQNWLSCNSDDVILQLRYNPFLSAELGEELRPELKKELQKSLKKVTPKKMESENIKFLLNKE